MKKIKMFFQQIFPKPARQVSVFSDALSEAFVDFFREMGYKTNDTQ
jgi:hypothetical protein